MIFPDAPESGRWNYRPSEQGLLVALEPVAWEHPLSRGPGLRGRHSVGTPTAAGARGTSPAQLQLLVNAARFRQTADTGPIRRRLGPAPA